MDAIGALESARISEAISKAVRRWHQALQNAHALHAALLAQMVVLLGQLEAR
jgi:hypothetical protein